LSKWFFFKGGEDFNQKFTTAEENSETKWTRAQILTILKRNCYTNIILLNNNMSVYCVLIKSFDSSLGLTIHNLEHLR